MKRMFAIFVLILLLCSCNASDFYDTNSLSTTEPTVEMTPNSNMATPRPASLHSELYIDGVSVDDIITYFNEVCLDAEFTDGGDPNFIQKWMSPIYYMIFGSPTEEDMAKLEAFVAWLNGIEGFPGMYEIDHASDVNCEIYFCDHDTMIDQLGTNFYDMDAGVTFWYDYDVIHYAVICYRTDLHQTLRNSVILEEIYNGLGPVQDTNLRPDSIIYSEYSEIQELSEIDEVIIKLLYHPDIQCGMDATACETVIRRLYY